MTQEPVAINRNKVGVIAAVLLAVAAALTAFGTSSQQELWAGACLKVGLVMGTLWLALPALTRNPVLAKASWTTVLGMMGIALIVARARVPMQIVIPVLITFILTVRFLGPRRNSPRT